MLFFFVDATMYSLLSDSFDHSWRLWDLETKTEILHQVNDSSFIPCVTYNHVHDVCWWLEIALPEQAMEYLSLD